VLFATQVSSRLPLGEIITPKLPLTTRGPGTKSAAIDVEGNSEIDLIIESSSLLIYIEAKLDSDISMRTTHDPARNQIIRNIDCLLDSARGRTHSSGCLYATPRRAALTPN
jgi:hypothetical protein